MPPARGERREVLKRGENRQTKRIKLAAYVSQRLPKSGLWSPRTHGNEPGFAIPISNFVKTLCNPLIRVNQAISTFGLAARRDVPSPSPAKGRAGRRCLYKTILVRG